jgi:glycosyltransferase involved in cell wall biosynthesis
MLSLAHRAWRLLPPETRRWALFSAMAASAPSPARPAPGVEGPITVAGYFRASSGLGEGARRLADMLEVAGAEVHRADLTGALRQGPPGPWPEVPEGPGTLIMHVNGPMLPWGMKALGARAVARKHVIGFWNWELPVMPGDWQRGFRFVHRVWGSSRFVAEAARPRAGAVPVQVVHYPVPEPSPAPLGRAELGLPAAAFVALSVFDASSSVERKNPLGAIAAHRAAFGDDPARLLVLKTYRTEQGGAAWAAVQQAAAGAANIRILDREMSRAEVWALIRCADAFVSLHRAEGVGLALAEAMRLGVPVVATGWSGNMDFMDADSAMLVGWRLVPAQSERGTYSVRGAAWAEPDTAEAALALRALADDPALRRRLAAAGLARMADFTPAACGARALALLASGGADAGLPSAVAMA